MERSCRLLGYFKTAFIWIATGLGFFLLTRRQPYDWLGFLLLCLVATLAAKLGYLPAAMRAVSAALRLMAVIVWSIAIILLCLMTGLLLYVMFRPDAGLGAVLVELVVILAGAVLIIYQTGRYRVRSRQAAQQGLNPHPLPSLKPMLQVDVEKGAMIRWVKKVPGPYRPPFPRRFGGW
ncbi:MAG: hypothetical protein U1F76_20890 [Candidatus Competibacteraceae bacterium]